MDAILLIINNVCCYLDLIFWLTEFIWRTYHDFIGYRDYQYLYTAKQLLSSFLILKYGMTWINPLCSDQAQIIDDDVKADDQG